MTTKTPVTVRYAETDAQGVVHHANYLVWFEEGRSDFLRQNGLNYTDFEKAGYFIVVAKAELKYKAPAFYEENLFVETSLLLVRSKMMKFTYRVLDTTGSVRAEGETVHFVLDQNRQQVALPEPLLAQMKGLSD